MKTIEEIVTLAIQVSQENVVPFKAWRKLRAYCLISGNTEHDMFRAKHVLSGMGYAVQPFSLYAVEKLAANGLEPVDYDRQKVSFFDRFGLLREVKSLSQLDDAIH